MPGSGLATRCPACGTVFRVVPDQLRVSEGWVRCGRCSEVFDASQSLTDIETGEARRGFGDSVGRRSAPPPPPPQRPAPTPPAPREPAGSVEAPAVQLRSAIERAFEEPAVAALDASAEQAPAPVEAPAAVVDAPAAPPDPRAEPGDRPSFVVQAERAERWQRPRVRAALVLVSLLGALGLAGQAVFEWRDHVAARVPAARPLLEQACAALGCRVEAARLIEGLVVESSGLVRVERSNIYRLSVALRNRAGFELALPALDITLTDNQGRVVARKAVQMADMGLTQTTLAAGRELALQATLQAATAGAGASAPETIVGYTIDLFYP